MLGLQVYDTFWILFIQILSPGWKQAEALPFLFAPGYGLFSGLALKLHTQVTWLYLGDLVADC